MKSLLLSLVTLAAGVTIGTTIAYWEVGGDRLPIGDSALQITDVSSAGNKRSPRIVVVNGERHNFGKMDRDAKGEHVFIIRNDGTAALTLVQGSTTCKCTLSQLNRDALQPGETAEVRLEWTAKTSERQFEQSAELITNDPVRPMVELRIEGQVIDLLRPEATQITLGNFTADEGTRANMKIFAYRGSQLQIDDYQWLVPATAEKFQVSFEPLSAEQIAAEPGAVSGVMMHLVAKPGLPMGALQQTIRLTTNFSEAAPLELQIVGNVVSDITLIGPQVDGEKLIVTIGPVQRSTGNKTKLYLVVKGPHRQDIKISVASVDPPVEFKATVGPPARDNPKIVRFPLTIEIPPGATPLTRMPIGNYAQIKLTTTHPDIKEMVINVRYAVTE